MISLGIIRLDRYCLLMGSKCSFKFPKGLEDKAKGIVKLWYLRIIFNRFANQIKGYIMFPP